MLTTLLKKLGTGKSAVVFTICAIIFSVCLYIGLSFFWGGILLRGVILASIIPAIIGPTLSYYFLGVIIRLDDSEKALLESQENYNAVYNRNLHCIFIHDFEGNFLDANDAALNLLGYNREEISSTNLSALIDEDQLPMAIEAIEELRQNGSLNRLIEFRLKKRSGGFVWVETDSSIIYRGGKPYAVLGVARDTTLRRDTVEALADSEKNYRHLFDNAADVILVVDPTGEFLELNRKFEEESGYNRGDMIGKNVFTCGILTKESNDRVQFYLTKVLEGRSLPVFEIDAVIKNGSIVPYELNAVPIKKDEAVIRIQATLRNLAERKLSYEERQKLEAQLRQAQKMEAIGTLAGGIAHDFNNLLMAIQGNVSLALLENDPAGNYHGLLRNIERQVENAAKLTSQLLGYARKGKYEAKIINMNELVEVTSDTFGRMRKDIVIDRDLDPSLYDIQVDTTQMEQVLLNIFVNASDAMPEGGALILKSKKVTHEDMQRRSYNPKPGKYIKLSITDTGIGMDKETQGRIFDPFFTTKGMGRGTGLGLASVYGIVKAHGGYIDVESEQGKGATFIIHLPASNQKLPKQKELVPKTLRGTGTILVVDDEAVVLEVGVKILKKLGYEVLEANSGKKAVEVFKANSTRIDLVILDVVMPGMSGGETFDEIKELNPNVKVLLSSGYTIDGQAKKIMARGCDGFIQKPFSLQALTDKLNDLI